MKLSKFESKACKIQKLNWNPQTSGTKHLKVKNWMKQSELENEGLDSYKTATKEREV